MNIPTNLNKIVPKKLRFELYNKALKFYENVESFAGLSPIESDGLCLLLPCLLWNLNDYRNNAPDSHIWIYQNVPKCFPEIKRLVNNIENIIPSNRNDYRIEYLKNIINKEKLKSNKNEKDNL